MIDLCRLPASPCLLSGRTDLGCRHHRGNPAGPQRRRPTCPCQSGHHAVPQTNELSTDRASRGHLPIHEERPSCSPSRICRALPIPLSSCTSRCQRRSLRLLARFRRPPLLKANSSCHSRPEGKGLYSAVHDTYRRTSQSDVAPRKVTAAWATLFPCLRRMCFELQVAAFLYSPHAQHSFMSGPSFDFNGVACQL